MCSAEILTEFLYSKIVLINNMLFHFLNLNPCSCFESEDIHGFICLAAQTREPKMHQRKICCSAPKLDSKLLNVFCCC